MSYDFTKIISNLEKNNMQGYFVDSRADVVAKMQEIMQPDETVAVGGSLTLFECDVIEYLRSGRYKFLDRYADGLTEEEIHEVHRQAFMADTYICGSNAITEDGELYNVDGNANRIAAIAYGPKSVIIVVGINKIVLNLDEAVHRVKTIAAPAVCRRRGFHTYCSEKGECISISKNALSMPKGCNSASRVCCSYLVCGQQRVKNRIKIILVNENLGF